MQYKKALIVLVDMFDGRDFADKLKFVKKNSLYWPGNTDFSDFIGRMSYYSNSQVTINHFRSEIQEVFKGGDTMPNILYMTHIFTAEDLVHFSDKPVEEIEEWLGNKDCFSPIENCKLNDHILNTFEMVENNSINKDKVIQIPSLLINANLSYCAFDNIDPAQVSHFIDIVEVDGELRIQSAN